MSRFVILRHTFPREHPRESHWDVMLQDDDLLLTWEVQEQPRTGITLAARRLPDHRLEYLRYEGPVSDGRGEVRRWDEGTYRALQWTDGRLQVDLAGEKLRGWLRLDCAPRPRAVDHFQRPGPTGWQR